MSSGIYDRRKHIIMKISTEIEHLELSKNQQMESEHTFTMANGSDDS